MAGIILAQIIVRIDRCDAHGKLIVWREFFEKAWRVRQLAGRVWASGLAVRHTVIGGEPEVGSHARQKVADDVVEADATRRFVLHTLVHQPRTVNTIIIVITQRQWLSESEFLYSVLLRNNHLPIRYRHRQSGIQPIGCRLGPRPRAQAYG